MWILLKIVIFLTLNIAVSKANLCLFQKSIFKNGNEFFQRKQYLISSVQYSLLFDSKCDDLSLKSRFNYSLAMSRLGEVSEVIEQYRFFKKRGPVIYQKRTKNLLDLKTSNTENVKVAFWNDLKNEALLKKIGVQNKDLFKLQQDYIAKGHVKNPLLAGIGSTLIPGLGQAYNGTYQSAVVAFIINGIFAWSTFEFTQEKLKAPAITSGIIFSITYLGNIMNAVKGSQKINTNHSALIKGKIKDHLFPELSLDQ